MLWQNKRMARKDIYHETVKKALDKDDWEITHDPFQIMLAKSAKQWIWVQND